MRVEAMKDADYFNTVMCHEYSFWCEEYRRIYFTVNGRWTKYAFCWIYQIIVYQLYIHQLDIHVFWHHVKIVKNKSIQHWKKMCELMDDSRQWRIQGGGGGPNRPRPPPPFSGRFLFFLALFVIFGRGIEEFGFPAPPPPLFTDPGSASGRSTSPPVKSVNIQ